MMSKQPESFSAQTLAERKRPQAPRPDEGVNKHCHGVVLPPPRLSRLFGTLMLVGRHGGRCTAGVGGLARPISKGKPLAWVGRIEMGMEGSTRGRQEASPQARLEGQGIPADTYQLVNDSPLAGEKIGRGGREVKKEKGAQVRAAPDRRMIPGASAREVRPPRVGRITF